VFYQDAAQQAAAKSYIQHLDESGAYEAPVCTELREAAKFWPAEQYHADYFALHPEQGYCQFVIAPKVQKFRKQFSSKLKN
jgi:peptide-methionine (S)-S-oxide reductase